MNHTDDYPALMKAQQKLDAIRTVVTQAREHGYPSYAAALSNILAILDRETP